jgi:hypothetical protein
MLLKIFKKFAKKVPPYLKNNHIVKNPKLFSTNQSKVSKQAKLAKQRTVS